MSSSTTETVALSPSIAAFGECLYIAWTGGDGALNVAAAEPGTYSRPYKFRERSTHSPSLTATADDGLALAWTGTDGHVNMIVFAVDPPGATPRMEQPKTRLDRARSGHAPAVCYHRETAVVAWTGTDRHINLLTNAADPAAQPRRLEQARSDQAPALCSHHDTLALAWTGTDRRVNLLTNAADPAAQPRRLEQAKTDRAPALCSARDALVLAWTGTDRRPNLGRVR